MKRIMSAKKTTLHLLRLEKQIIDKYLNEQNQKSKWTN